MPVIMILVGPMIEGFTVCDDHAAFAGRHGFVVVEAEDPHIAEGAQFFPLERAAASLGIVLQDPEVMTAGHFHDPAIRAAEPHMCTGMTALV